MYAIVNSNVKTSLLPGNPTNISLSIKVKDVNYNASSIVLIEY
jgi:hypothetical protein